MGFASFLFLQVKQVVLKLGVSTFSLFDRDLMLLIKFN